MESYANKNESTKSTVAIIFGMAVCDGLSNKVSVSARTAAWTIMGLIKKALVEGVMKECF